MATSISVLHVDDEPQFLDMVASFLRRESDTFEVETVTSATAALEAIADNGFECIVSDYDMPELNGIEFLQRLRRIDEDLPFILFTGKGSEEVASDAITAGATDYLQKQQGSDQYRLLANRIHNAVEKYRTEAARRRSEQRYHNLVDTAPIPILLFDTAGELLYANDAAISFLEAESVAAIEGEPFTAFLAGEDAETAQDRFRNLMQEGGNAPEIEYAVETVAGNHKSATVATAYGYYRGERVAQAMIYH